MKRCWRLGLHVKRRNVWAVPCPVCNLQTRMSSAVDVLAVMMVNPEVAATVRVSAADSILRHGLRYVEQFEIIRRIERLEASTKNEEVDV